MAIFQDVKMGWKNEDFVIPANRVMGAIAVVEETITFAELIECMRRGKPPLVQISKAFAGMLRYAGANVTDEEVYAGMFDTDTSVAERIINAVNMLLVLMMPPASMAGLKAANDKVTRRGNPVAARKPSKPSGKRRSARAA